MSASDSEKNLGGFMEFKVYSIRDCKSEVYNQPFMKNTHGEAEREFGMLLRDDRSMVKNFPDDFDLFFIGTWDNKTGLYKPLNTPQHIQKASNIPKGVA